MASHPSGFWQYSGREDASNNTGPFEMEKKAFLNMKKNYTIIINASERAVLFDQGREDILGM